ncbi:hypothetical protein P171DRAFT_513945 [Karstenula rhodostoma CBS 690.94]|uniref:Uncharacterized protein n=1 Tax=Karstenula rhodostoma CBS 690.94 TaxID=1392251 RepID=A0A9P4PIM2_9PLEO|nr:hypothetical protein P171DRAFT_513945 [Karstenula rhodostoma CBS 690.94]
MVSATRSSQRNTAHDPDEHRGPVPHTKPWFLSSVPYLKESLHIKGHREHPLPRSIPLNISLHRANLVLTEVGITGQQYSISAVVEVYAARSRGHESARGFRRLELNWAKAPRAGSGYLGRKRPPWALRKAVERVQILPSYTSAIDKLYVVQAALGGFGQKTPRAGALIVRYTISALTL